MALAENKADVHRQFQDLVLDLNLDKATADEAWDNYETLKQQYVMEGDQLSWVACAVYGACRMCTLPTVGGRPGTTVQGNCVSLTRMLHFCNLTLMEFIKKKRLWAKMAHLDEPYMESINLLERKYAVSNNMYKKYHPIFLDLFSNPDKDAPRPVRSRKQRKLPCNATELYNFCWTLYILIKGRFPGINKELVMSYSLLLACIELMYSNVRAMGRTDLLNTLCQGYPSGSYSPDTGWTSSLLPESIMDYLCNKFEGVVVETKVVRDYHFLPTIKTLVNDKILKGSESGLCLLEGSNMEHNVKEVRNGYETDLLSTGEFDERMFLSNDPVLGSAASSPVHTSNVTPMPHLPRRGIMMPGDHHLLPQTPITGRSSIQPSVGGLYQHMQLQQSPLAAAATAVRRLHLLLSGRTNRPSRALIALLGCVSSDSLSAIQEQLNDMSARFCRLYCVAEGDPDVTPGGGDLQQQENITPLRDGNNEEEEPSDVNKNNSSYNENGNTSCSEVTIFSNYNSKTNSSGNTTPNLDFTKNRLKMAQVLFYTFLENIIQDENKKGVSMPVIMKQELIFRTLFVCCVELVLKCYDDPRRFPWSLQVGNVAAYNFVRIIELVVRSEQQSDNRMSRELVNHLKRIEEQVLDSLAWQNQSPLWLILKEERLGVPSCSDVNFSNLLDYAVTTTSDNSSGGGAGSGDSITSGQLAPPASVLNNSKSSVCLQQQMSYTSPRQSPLSSAASERLGLQSPLGGSRGSVKRTLLFPADDSGSSHNMVTPSLQRQDTERIAADSNGVSPSPTSLCRDDSAPGERPRRHGSLAIFFRKVYIVANLRLRDLCDRLQIESSELRRQIWTCLEHSIRFHTHLLQDRHLDQLIMCAVYIMCKVTRKDRSFQEIMKQYRCQPQADSHIYRSVLIERRKSDNGPTDPSPATVTPGEAVLASTPSDRGSSSGRRSNMLPWEVNGTSKSFKTEERGDLINFYNNVYTHNLKTFALKYKSNNANGVSNQQPPLSPVPLLRVTPGSPRCRISSSRPVFVHSLSPLPVTGASAAAAQRRLPPYYINRSPAKELRDINSMIHLRAASSVCGTIQTGVKRPAPVADSNSSKRPMIGLCKRLHTVLDERQQSTESGFSDTSSVNRSASDHIVRHASMSGTGSFEVDSGSLTNGDGEEDEVSEANGTDGLS